MIQQKIDATCPAFDLSAACAGFPYALTVADSFIRAGNYKYILALGAEVISTFINWKDRSTCVLFGDGAGAAVIGVATEGSNRILSTMMGADGKQADLLKIPAGGSAIPTTAETLGTDLHCVRMEGTEVFKHAVKRMSEAVHVALEKANMKLEEVDCLIPHQANLRILDALHPEEPCQQTRHQRVP